MTDTSVQGRGFGERGHLGRESRVRRPVGRHILWVANVVLCLEVARAVGVEGSWEELERLTRMKKPCPCRMKTLCSG